MHAWPTLRSAWRGVFCRAAPGRAAPGRAIVLAVLAAAGASAADSVAPPTAGVRLLAASCAACHGTDGRAVRITVIPALAGMSKDAFAAQMRAFRSGARNSTIMRQIVTGYDDAQIDALAEYFAQLPPGGEP
jgi:cytochrome c553